MSPEFGAQFLSTILAVLGLCLFYAPKGALHTCLVAHTVKYIGEDIDVIGITHSHLSACGCPT